MTFSECVEWFPMIWSVFNEIFALKMRTRRYLRFIDFQEATILDMVFECYANIEAFKAHFNTQTMVNSTKDKEEINYSLCQIDITNRTLDMVLCKMQRFRKKRA